jgi:hypothetical protein
MQPHKKSKPGIIPDLISWKSSFGAKKAANPQPASCRLAKHYASIQHLGLTLFIERNHSLILLYLFNSSRTGSHYTNQKTKALMSEPDTLPRGEMTTDIATVLANTIPGNT